jgi:hypothetical protein
MSEKKQADAPVRDDGVVKSHRSNRQWLVDNCDFVKHHIGPEPIDWLDGKHYEIDMFYFMFDQEDEDTCGAGIRVDDPGEDDCHLEVYAINLKEDGGEDGNALLGFFKSLDDLKELLTVLVKANMEPSSI